MINGISNSFSATIDGLTNFELSTLSVDELDAKTINVETEIFTPIVVLKDGDNTTTMSQVGLDTIIQNDENLGTMTFNTKGPFGANVQSLTLSYLTATVNTSVLQVNGRVQPNTIRFPDGVTVGDKVVYLRGDNIYKDYKVTLRNAPDSNGDLFYNIPVGYAHTFSYGDTSYVNILSIRSNGDIVFTDITGNKITYYTGYSTEILTNILRHIVPSAASHNFKVGTTDIVTISSSGVAIHGNITGANNIALKDAANTFTHTNTFPRIDFSNVDGVKMLYRTNVNGDFQTEIISGDLKHTVPSFARFLFNIAGADALYISLNNLGETVLFSGSNIIFDTLNTTNEHLFHIQGTLVAAIGLGETRFRQDVEIGFNDGINDSINDLVFRNYLNGGFSTLGYNSPPAADDGIFYIRAARTVDNVNSVYRSGNITFRIQNAAGQTRPIFSIDDTGAIVRLGKKLYFENEIPVISGSIYSNFFEQMEYDSSQGHRFKINGTEVFNFDSVYAHFVSNLEMDLGFQISFQNAAGTVSGQIYANSSEHIIHNSNVKHVFKIATTDVMYITSSGVDITGECFLRSAADPAYYTSLRQFDTGLLRVRPNHPSSSFSVEVSDSGSVVYDAIRLHYTDGVECYLNLTVFSGNKIFMKDSTGAIETSIYTDDITGLCVFDKTGTTDGYLFKANGVELGKITTGACEFFTNFGVRSGFGLRLYDPTNTDLCSIATQSDYTCRYRSEIGHRFNVRNTSTALFEDVLTVLDRAVSITGTLTVSGAFTVSSGSNLVQSGTGIISQTGTGTNLMKGITMNANNTLVQSGSGVITQTGTGTNTMKAITLDVDDNLTLSGTGSITFSPDSISTKLTYYTGFTTAMQSATELRHTVPTGCSHKLVVNTVAIATVDTNGITLGQGQLICPSGVGNKITYSSNYVVSNASSVLRTSVPTGATHHLSVNNVDVMSVSSSTTTIRNNITLPTTQTAQTSGQLGYIHNGTILSPTTAIDLTTNVVQQLGSMTLPVGVWNVFGQFTCKSMTGSGVLTKEEYSLSTTATTINNSNLEIANYTAPYFTPANNAIFCRRINTIFSSTGSQLVYMTIRYNFTSGTFQVNSTNQTDYCRFYAVRIA